MSDLPDVTVCIAVYNDTTYLGDALTSAAVQAPVEVLIVDDGSDRPVPHFEPHKPHEDYIRVIRTSHRGPQNAWNTGLMNAKGEWFLPLASDDWLEPDCLEWLLSGASSFDVVLPAMQEHGGQDTLYIPRLASLEEQKSANRFPYCALYRTAYLRSVGGWHGQLATYPDWALWIDLLERRARIALEARAVVHYRVHDGQHSKRITEEEHQAEIARVREFFP